MKTKTNNTITGTTGEYFVSAELGKRGVLALMTPKNNPLFDVVAVNEDATKYAFIQVKTNSEGNTQGWKLNKQIVKKKNNSNLFLILVNIKKDSPCDYYIFKYDDFAERVSQVYKAYIEVPKKTGEKKKEVGFRWFDFKNFNEVDKSNLNNWEILGF